MRTYGMGYWEILDLPVSLFWIVNRNISRLQAEEDLRRFDATRAAQSSDEHAAKEIRQSYVKELSGTFVQAEELDRNALYALKAKL